MWTKEVVRNLINEYEKYPCLYLVSSVDYKNKIKKYKAFQCIIESLKETGVTATIDDVKKKIHGLKTQYSVEMKKIKASKSSGAGESDVYEPTLWCFDLLGFLNDTSFPQRIGENNIDMIQDEVVDETLIFEGSLEEFQNSAISQDMVPSPATSVKSVPTERAAHKSKRKRSTSNQGDDALEGLIVDASKILASVANKNAVDNLEVPDAFCLSVAQELGIIKNYRILQRTKRKIMNLIFDAQEEYLEYQDTLN